MLYSTSSKAMRAAAPWRTAVRHMSGSAAGKATLASILDKVAAKAAAVRSERGQLPRLGLVTVGELAEGHTSAGASSREAIAPAGQSWFNKAAAGEKNGVLVEQLDLPYSTGTPDLLAALAALSRRCDGIQLMWPLPAHVDAVAAYAGAAVVLEIGRASCRERV